MKNLLGVGSRWKGPLIHPYEKVYQTRGDKQSNPFQLLLPIDPSSTISMKGATTKN
jgi:hypothetical protein